MTKKDASLTASPDWEKAASQRVLNASVAETHEHLARKDVGGDYAGKENRAKGDDFNPRIAERDRHLAVRAARDGDAIEQLEGVMTHGQAINEISSKRGSRAPRGESADLLPAQTFEPSEM